MTTDAPSRETTLRAVAQTARWTAAARARETERPDRLFSDPFAGLLAGTDGPALLRHFHTAHAAEDGNPFLPIRTRWFDDFLRASVTSGRQVVGLGVGLDSRAYRLSWPPGTVMFEVDQPELLSYKNELLAAEGSGAGCQRRMVPVDLAQDWRARLLDAGYDPHDRSVWFAEGLLFYLPDQLAGQTVEWAAELACPGSRLAVDLIGTGVFRLRYLRTFLRRLERAGSPWRFATDEPARFVAERGWRVDELTEPGDPGANYGRWPERANTSTPANLPRSFLVAASLTERRHPGASATGARRTEPTEDTIGAG
jgi:methyltransferase (TIGR00027 family)